MEQTEENIVQSHMPQTQSGTRMSQGLSGVASSKGKEAGRFTALLHHLSIDLLRDSFHALKRQAARRYRWRDLAEVCSRLGDSITRSPLPSAPWRVSNKSVETSLHSEGTATPVGIAALGDKIVQQAVVTILN